MLNEKLFNEITGRIFQDDIVIHSNTEIPSQNILEINFIYFNF